LNRSRRFERLERLKRPRYRFSAVKELRSHLAYLGKTHIIYEIDDFVQRRFDNLVTAANDTKTQDRALPQILIPTFCNGDIKPVGYPRLDLPEDSPLAF